MNYENILATLMKGNSYDISIKAVWLGERISGVRVKDLGD
jgi:hypothetical protein